MKNRVNISQLIEEKYKDKNTFSAKEFDELIDSVLTEGLANYLGKVDTENLEHLTTDRYTNPNYNSSSPFYFYQNQIWHI